MQSVALRIIADRENEINAFIPVEYWTIGAKIKVAGEKKRLDAKFYGTEKGRLKIENKEQAETVRAELLQAEYQVLDVKKSERTKKAPFPFTTSTLQQEASKVLNFSTLKRCVWRSSSMKESKSKAQA